MGWQTHEGVGLSDALSLFLLFAPLSVERVPLSRSGHAGNLDAKHTFENAPLDGLVAMSLILDRHRRPNCNPSLIL